MQHGREAGALLAIAGKEREAPDEGAARVTTKESRRAYWVEYGQRPGVRERKKLYMAAYAKTETFKTSRDRYEKSAAGKAARKRRNAIRATRPHVKALRKIAHIKRTYGLTREEHANLVAKQNGSCAICQRTARLVIDHNHKTGSVRGLLCIPCNTAIGSLRDSPQILDASKKYLQGETA